MALEVSVSEAATDLQHLLDLALAGEDVTTGVGTRVHLARAEEKPEASAPFQRKVGSAKGMFVVPDDFLDPLPDEIIDEFYRVDELLS